MARPIRSAVDAERAALEALVARGYGDARLTPGGPDQGVDVVATGLVGQVKAQVIPVGAPIVQQIAGIASVERARAVAFGLGGFTPAAYAFAERADVGLFGFDLEGKVIPLNRAARSLAETGASPAVKLDWSIEAVGEIDQYLPGVLGILIRGSGFIAALNNRTGSLLFERDLSWTELVAAHSTTFVLAVKNDDNRVDIGRDDVIKAILVLDQRGQERAVVEFSKPVSKVASAGEGTILVVHDGHWQSATRLECIRLADATRLWELELPTKTDAELAVLGGSVYIEVDVGKESRLLCIALSNGELSWGVPISERERGWGSSGGRAPLLLEAGVVPASSWFGPSWLSCYHQATGQLMWKSDRMHQRPDEMLVVGDVVVMGHDDDESLTGIDGTTGKLLWRLSHPVVGYDASGNSRRGWFQSVRNKLVVDSQDGGASEIIEARSGKRIGIWPHGCNMTQVPRIRRKRLLFVNGRYLIAGAPGADARKILLS